MQCHSTGGNLFVKGGVCWWIETDALVNDGSEVGQGQSFAVADGGGDEVVGDGVRDFGLESGECRGGGEERKQG